MKSGFFFPVPTFLKSSHISGSAGPIALKIFLEVRTHKWVWHLVIAKVRDSSHLVAIEDLVAIFAVFVYNFTSISPIWLKQSLQKPSLSDESFITSSTAYLSTSRGYSSLGGQYLWFYLFDLSQIKFNWICESCTTNWYHWWVNLTQNISGFMIFCATTD